MNGFSFQLIFYVSGFREISESEKAVAFVNLKGMLSLNSSENLGFFFKSRMLLSDPESFRFRV